MTLSHYACKRAYLTDKNFLTDMKKYAKFVGEANFTDYVFGSANTDKNLFWVREIHKNVWPSMKVGKFYPFFKANIIWSSGFQIFDMPVGMPMKECSSLQEAQRYLPDKLKTLFSFNRTTQEFMQNNLSIYIEEVEHIPATVEIVCKTEKQSLKKNMETVDKFMKKYKLTKIIPHQVATLVKKELRR